MWDGHAMAAPRPESYGRGVQVLNPDHHSRKLQKSANIDQNRLGIGPEVGLMKNTDNN